MLYQDRFHAGRVLADRLVRYRDNPDVLVLALPRGGVPVALEVAKALHAPLDVFLVRKLGLPGHEELAIGAIASGNVRVLNEDVVRALQITPQLIDDIVRRERRTLERQERIFRGGRPMPDVRDRIVIIIDDGLATGSTMRAAVTALRQQRPKRLVVAVPVGSAETCAEMQLEADEVICAADPTDFLSVGTWYQDFAQTPDELVKSLLEEAARWHPAEVT
jgi:putative phosphoribosyl transferase